MKRLFLYIVLLVVVSCVSVKSNKSQVDKPLDILSGLVDSTYSSDQRATDYYLRGVYFARHKNDDSTAISFLKRAIQADSLHAASMFEIASLSDYKADSTLNYIKKAVEIDSTNSWYRYLLSKIYAAKGYHNEAIFEAEKTINLGQRSSDTYQYMAALYQMKERPMMAISVLDSAMVLYGYQMKLVGQKLEQLTKLGMTDKQIEFLKDVIASGDESQRHYLSLGNAYLQKGQDSVALSYFNKARQIYAEDPAVAYTFMEYYRSKEMVSEFLSEMINIVKNNYVSMEGKISLIEPLLKNEHIYRENWMLMDNLMTIFYYQYYDDYDVVKLYVRHLINVGKVDDALKCYIRFTQTDPPQKDAYINVIGIHTYQKSYDSAMLFYEKAMEIFPSDNEIAMMGVTIAYGSKDFDQAIKVTQNTIKHIESDSLKSIQYGIIGDLYHEKGDMKKTYSNYDKALSLNKNNITVLNNYSYFLSLEERDLERALDMIERVMAKESSSATHLDTHAWILHKLGRNEEARKVMQKAVALDRDGSKDIFDHYAYILYELGNSTMARLYWDKALKSGLSEEEYDKRILLLEEKK